MDRSAYAAHLELDQKHFWRAAKRKLVRGLLAQDPNAGRPLRILDIGGAASVYPKTLAEFGSVVVVEPDGACVAVAREQLGLDIREGSLPHALGVEGPFDVISMLDVLEHIEDDTEALEVVRDLLVPGGRLILTVPALPLLYSDHDRALHHFRRYTRSSLSAALQSADLRIRTLGYWTSLLLPLVAAQRAASQLKSRLRPGQAAKYSVKAPRPWLNSGLSQIMTLERALLRTVPMPLGSSLYAVAERIA